MPAPPILIVIVGPTASGKSALAVRLAKKFRGEIVSADSRQIYHGLDIGTGKITRREMRGVAHHLIDVADPKRQFSVAQFQELAHRAIRDIGARGKIPFLVGGTAFWVDAVAYGLRLPAVAPNEALRKRLENKNAAELFQILKRLDLARARTIERQNPRRLIRAIEVARALGRVPKLEKRPGYRTLWLGIAPPRAELEGMIHRRLLRRMREGMIAEARRLRRQGLPWERFYQLGLEYRFLADHLRGVMNRQKMVNAIERATRRYARKQLAWFGRNRRIRWTTNATQAERILYAFLASDARRRLIASGSRRARGARKG